MTRTLTAFLLLAATTHAADPTKIKPEVFQKWGGAETVVAARLTRVSAGPVGLSEPPLRSYQMLFLVDQSLRGPLRVGDSFAASYSVRQKEEPTFPERKSCLVSLSFVRNAWVVRHVEEAKGDEVAQAQAACAVPLGWSLEKGNFVSPWAKLGKGAWSPDSKVTGSPVCSVTGRPGLLVGPGVEFKVEKVAPKKAIQFQNPDGDGEYTVAVKNVSDKALTVPALLTDGKAILWDDCLVIRCQNKVYPIPGAKGVKGEVKSVTLKPGEETSAVVNALRLDGPEWPRGGYRIEFTFCLGERSATQSFYYFSRHHDAIRQGLQK